MTIELRDVGMAFGDERVLTDVNLDISAGERFAIMGPSGAGKSTLLRVIAGLEPDSTGTVRVNGTDVTAMAPHQRSVGLMFQDLALFPHLRVGDNVAFGLRMSGLPRDARAERVRELLGIVDLPDFADRPITALSGGERQRVALARTLAPEPSVILFDEPLGSLDQGLKDDLLVQMRTIVEAMGTTALYVTHDRMEAEGFSDRMSVMRSSVILRTDTPEAMWSDPRTEFIARFMGHTNIVEGDAVGHADRLVAIRGDAISIGSPGDNPLFDAAHRISGTVSSCLFRDGRYRVTVRIADATPVHLTTDTQLRHGATVALHVDPAGIMPLTSEGLAEA